MALSREDLLLGSRPSRGYSVLPTTPAPAPLPAANGNQYSDPYTSLFETVSKNAMTRLAQPFQDDTFDEVLNLIRGRVGSVSSMAAPSFVGNAYMGDYANEARKRIGELNQEPFSAAEESRLKTGALEAIEKNRSSSKQRALENISRRGIADTSGILLEMEGDIDRGADSDRATSEREFANYVTSERNRRKDSATQIAAGLAALGSQEAAMANSNAVAGANFGLAKEGQLMGLASQLADLAAQRRGEMRANQNDILTIAQSLMNLGPQRLALMQSVLNGQPSPGELFSNTLNLSNTQANQNAVSNQGNAALMGGLGQILAYLAANSGGGK
jgi:hypothetical protein